jgi:hypothetical protein
VNIKNVINRSFIAFALLGVVSINAQAANCGGKFDVASSTGGSTPMIRYYVAAQGLSIFASGINETLLHEAFFRKATVSISYNVVVCPLGIVGTCGNLTSINVDASGFQ